MSAIKIFIEPQDGKTWEDICEEVDSGKTKRVVFRGVEFVKEKHGHWEDCENGWKCSCCGGENDLHPTPYCMWCGAKMDEVEDEID